MKNHNKITGIILSLCAIAALLTVSCFNAFAIGVTPITANEGKLTMWILVGLVVAAAAAGVIYFIIHRKNKKKLL